MNEALAEQLLTEREEEINRLREALQSCLALCDEATNGYLFAQKRNAIWQTCFDALKEVK